MKNNPQSSPFDYKSFGKQPQGQHYTSPLSPIPALRFIDQIDFYLWQASGDETIVLNKISGTLKNELQVAW
jgi:hypothetical protein